MKGRVRSLEEHPDGIPPEKGVLFSWDCCFKANLIRMICQVFKTANKASKHCRTTPYSLTCNWNTLKRIEIGGEAAFQEMIKILTKIMKASKKPGELQYILLDNKSPQNVVAQKNQLFPFCRLALLDGSITCCGKSQQDRRTVPFRT